MPAKVKTLHFETIDSTNHEAQRLVTSGEKGPLWLRADEQVAGKGRLGRHWVSKPGNLYSTLIWPTSAPQACYAQLSFVAAIAVAETAKQFASGVTLKWPNDCLLNGAKFSGILCEVLQPGLIAIGIGVNIAHVPEGLLYKVAHLKGANVDVVFDSLKVNLSKNLQLWNDGNNFDAIRAHWMKLCPHIGHAVKVDGMAGVFAGLADDGALLLRFATGEHKAIYAGDVQVEYKQI